MQRGLLSDIEKLDKWPETVKAMQTNWIGKSTGVEMDFSISGHDEKLSVFTTRCDTIFGMTYVVLAPEHPLVNKVTTEKYKKEVKEYCHKALKKTEIERLSEAEDKTGVFYRFLCY